MKRLIAGVAVIATNLGLSGICAAGDWNAIEYYLIPGDFNGDGKVDLLYVAKDVSRSSGIALSDASGPNIPWQSWPSGYLGIPWSSGLYKPHVADFNGDERADILLQRIGAGDSYLLHADAHGKITSITQTLPSAHLGFGWGTDQHELVTGDFDGDNRADVFLQAKAPAGLNAVFLADTYGQFTSGPAQSWSDAGFGFSWSSRTANVHSGDFNGDGRSDLLVQAKPKIVMIDYEIPIPVPVYPPNANGVVLSAGGTSPFAQYGVQQWSRNSSGADWAPSSANLVIGDFNGDGASDVLFQATNSSRGSYVAYGQTSGSAFGAASALPSNVTWATDSYRLIAGNFDGSGGAGIYFQAASTAGANYIANDVSPSGVSPQAHNPSLSTGVVPASLVGKTEGSFAVTNTGSATYSVPIVVPPGVAGMQPMLSIGYVSGGTNGLLGVGWGLSGLSEISRCAKTIAQDGVTDGAVLQRTDALCLDGNRLRLTGGTYGYAGSTYQTEIEQFSRVTAYGSAGEGPAHFIVEGKDGLFYEYGNSLDSAIEVQGVSTLRTWALNKVRDRSGNSLTVTYIEDAANGSFRPDEIMYGANSAASTPNTYKVKFVWESRPSSDVLSGYFAGGLIRETNRLNRVETQHYDGSWNLVRKYQLSYQVSEASGRSRLAAIQECDRVGACLSPTMVSWQDGIRGWEMSPSQSAVGSAPLLQYSHTIDVDGDGRDDIVYPKVASGSATTTWHVARANNTGGFDAPLNSGIDAGVVSNYAYALSFDYQSDGKRDLVVAIPGTSSSRVLSWNGSNLIAHGTNLGYAISDKNQIGDFNGDGREDILRFSADGIFVRLNTGSNFSAETPFFDYTSTPCQMGLGNVTPQWNLGEKTGDFNGDGRDDIVFRFSYACSDPEQNYTENGTWWAVGYSTGSQFVPTTLIDLTYSPSTTIVPLVLDANGDGIADLAIADSVWSLYLGTGNGSFQGGSTGITAYRPRFAQVADYDGDGRDDVIDPRVSSFAAPLLRSTGTTLVAQTIPEMPLTAVEATAQSVRTADFNGDGLLDLGYMTTNLFVIQKHLGRVPDHLVSVTDGFGNNVQIEYAPLTDASVYTKGSGAAFPEIDVQYPMYVVKGYSASNGIGGTSSFSLRYSGARVHLQGRGFEGFSSRVDTDLRNNMTTRQSFRQTFPYTGMVSEAEVKQSASGNTISLTTNTPAVLQLSTQSYNERQLPYVITSTTDTYEVGGTLNGTFVARKSTTVTLDSYGNPTMQRVTSQDPIAAQTFITQTDATIINDTANWCLGRPTSVSVTNTVPGGSAATRVTNMSHNYSNCRITQQIVAPNVTNYSVTTDFGYDAFGNVNSQTVTGNGMTPRVNTAVFGGPGVFPTSLTNAESEQTAASWNYALGVPQSVTDPNLQSIYVSYDNLGRRSLVTRPDATQTRWTYSSCSIGNGYCGDALLRFQVQQDELDATAGHAVISTSVQKFDAFGRAKYGQGQTLTGATTTVATEYDEFGRLKRKSMPFKAGEPVFHVTAFYDLIGRPIRQERPTSDTDSTNHITRYEYAGTLFTQFDANNKTTKQRSNAIGQVVRATDATNQDVTYEYDPFGNLLKTIDPAGNEIRNTFHIRGFKSTTHDPDLGDWVYTYNALGELVTQEDAKHQVVSFTYDRLSRPKTRSEAEGTTTFTFGNSLANRNIGKLASISAPGFLEQRTYDTLGRPQNVTTTVESIAYQYSTTYSSVTGLPETLTYPTSTSAVPGSRFKVQYEYAYGLMKAVKDFNTPATVYWQAVQSNAAGQVTDSLFANGLHTLTTHDAVTGLMKTLATGNNGAIQNLSYQWDKVGNLTQRKDEGRSLTETFAYDDLYRMTDTYLNNTLTLHVGYNAIGNITSRSDVSGSYSYPASGTNSVRPHAVTQVGSAPAYQYDANGNMTSRGGSTIAWTSFNLPSQIASGANSSQFTYGPDRQRWKHVANTSGSIETTISIGGLFDKVTRGATVDYRHYIPVNGANIIRTVRVAAGGTTLHTYYTSTDNLGSADVVTNESGAIIVRESFAPFGGRRGSNWTGAPTTPEMDEIAAISRDGFTGHEMLDSVGLVHMNGRVYDQQIGRFISADPYVQDPFDSQSFNRYSYVGNNPLSSTDPSGFFRWTDYFNPSAPKNPHFLGKAAMRVADRISIGDRILRKNPKWQVGASAIASTNPWAGMGVNMHLARLNGAGSTEIVVAGALGFLSSYVSDYFTELFTPAGYAPGVGAKTAGAAVGGWVANHGIGGVSQLNSDVVDAQQSGRRETLYGAPYMLNIEPQGLAQLRAASAQWREYEQQVWEMSLPIQGKGIPFFRRGGRPAREHRLFVIQDAKGGLRFVIGAAADDSRTKMKGSLFTSPSEKIIAIFHTHPFRWGFTGPWAVQGPSDDGKAAVDPNCSDCDDVDTAGMYKDAYHYIRAAGFKGTSDPFGRNSEMYYYGARSGAQ